MAVGDDGIRLKSHVYQSLAQPRMVDGVHFSQFMINTGLMFFAVTSLKLYWWIPIFWVIHKFLGYFGKKDPIVLTVYIRYTRQAFSYQSWPNPFQRMGFRPFGFKKGTWN